MNKKINSRIVVNHLITWIAYYSIISLGLIGTWSEVPKVPMAYNYLSLIVVFYAVLLLSGHQLKKLNYNIYRNLDGRKRLAYLYFNVPVAGIIFTAFLYILGSWYIDHYVFNIVYPDFYLYCSGRLTREAAFIFAAIGISYFYEYKARQEAKHLANEVKIINLKQYIEKQEKEQQEMMNYLIEEVKKYRQANSNGI